MKSQLSLSMSVLLVALLGLACLNLESVEAKGNLVRGAHPPKTLKNRFAMHARQLMEDKNKDPEDDDEEEEEKEKETEAPTESEDEKDEKEEEEEEEEDEEDDEEDKEDDEEETDAPGPPVVEPGVEAPQEGDDMPTEGEVEVPALPNATMPEESETVGQDETFHVALEPFSITVDTAIEEEVLTPALEDYLLTYMQTFAPNLIDVSLHGQTVEDGAVAVDAAEEDTNSTGSDGARKLRASFQRTQRFLAEQTFYYEGNATFQGPPMRTEEEVDAVLTQALTDTGAIQTHFASANMTITASTDTAVSPEAAAETTQAPKEEESSGLSTTGLSIVIVAACVGGISLLIILMVGLSGPSGATGGVKGGLPEQPLQ